MVVAMLSPYDDGGRVSESCRCSFNSLPLLFFMASDNIVLFYSFQDSSRKRSFSVLQPCDGE